MKKYTREEKRLLKADIEGLDSIEVELEDDDDPIKANSWTTINKKTFPEDRWRIKNLIPKEGFVILSSIAGEKKTWVGLEMAKCIALGTNFLGNPEFETLGGNILYLDMEMPESELQRRGRQLGLSEVVNKFWILNKDDLDLSDAKDLLYLRHFVMENQICTIFVDTFRAVAGGLKEDKAEEVREFFNNFREFKNEGVAVVFLDHFRKPSNFEGKVPKKEHLLGSQDKTASVEVLLMMKSEDGSNEISIYQRKNRLAIEYKPFRVLIQDHLNEQGQVTTALSYGGLIEEDARQLERAKEVILAMLAKDGRTRKAILEVLKREADIGSRNASEAIRQLQAGMAIRMEKQGRENFYFLEDLETTQDQHDEHNLFKAN